LVAALPRKTRDLSHAFCFSGVSVSLHQVPAGKLGIYFVRESLRWNYHHRTGIAQAESHFGK
jgi:hypothetical protein